jgi:benzoylformate decarboxylase
VGPGVARTGDFDDVVALAEKLEAAVWQEPICALSGFPQNHRLFQGHLPAAQKAMAGKLAPYDVVLTLGAPVFTYYPYLPGPVVEEGTRVFQITEDPEEAARAAVGESAVGDVALGIRGLIERLPESDRSAPAEREPAPEPEASEPMSVAYAMHAISEALPDAPVVVDESTSSKGTLYEHIRVDEPDGHHTSAAGGLGFCLPASVGLKLALPERAVVCVIGDGSSMYSIQALYTAAQYEVAVPILVINNSGYSILKGFRDAIGIKNVPGLDLPGLDIVQIAQGYGCKGERVEKPGDLPPALERALASEGPYVVDIAVDETVPKMFG